MYDYLGTFTERQLRERHAFLKAQVHTLPGIINHLLLEAQRIAGFVGDVSDMFTDSHEQEEKAYNLRSYTVPRIMTKDSYLATLSDAGSAAKYPMKMDPLTGDISHGDWVWRYHAKLRSVSEYKTNFEEINQDDQVPAVRSDKILKPFRTIFKRPEYWEERSKKAKYRYMVILDDVAEKRELLENFEDELAAVEEMLSNTVEVTGSSGQTDTTSEYLSAGAERKTDVSDPADVERLIDLFLPGGTKQAATDEEADQPAQNMFPVDTSPESVAGPDRTVDIDENSPPGDITQLLDDFPSIAVKDRKRLQLMANIWQYGRDILVEVPESSTLFIKPRPMTFPYAPPNVAEALQSLSEYIFAEWGLYTRCVELFPSQAMHATYEHFTGNAADVTLQTQPTGLKGGGIAYRGQYNGVAVADVTNNILKYGLENGLLKGWYNEYLVKSTHGTGPHLHLWFDPIYFNSGPIITLGTNWTKPERNWNTHQRYLS